MQLLSKLKGSHGQQMFPRRKREKGLFGKRMRLVSFHLAIARSTARSFLLAAGNCLERALRQTTKKTHRFCQLFTLMASVTAMKQTNQPNDHPAKSQL